MKTILRLFNTVKYLQFKQVFYRLYYLIKNKFNKREYTQVTPTNLSQMNWKDSFLYKNSFLGNQTFVFLNKTHNFKSNIDWNFSEYGKLWTYNLNYFDFLNQESFDVQDGIRLIKNYIEKDYLLIDGKEPYPISLRGINWIKFLSRNNISNIKINQILYNHYQILLHNLEYHLLGNHLLENGFSLLFGAYYFKDESLYKVSTKILKSELNEQILTDGAHFELSPMYHQIILHRILDCIALIKQNNWKDEILLGFLQEKSSKMLSWLQVITYRNGNIPMVNDSAYEIAPTSAQLFNYSNNLGINWNHDSKLNDSGYRKYNTNYFELFIDIGDIKPSYQPGHSHSDTLSYEIYSLKGPLVVDTGTSTYEKNQLRQKERGTSSHNTVQIDNFEQSDVWGGFRVGRRAKIIRLVEDNNTIKASHNGYKKLGIIHERSFEIESNTLTIKDKLSSKTNLTQKAYFHFHPDVKNIEINEHTVIVDDEICIVFGGDIEIKLNEYQYAKGFNNSLKAKKIIVFFNQFLETKFNF